MTYHNVILLLTLFLITSCRGKDNPVDPTFRWQKLTADADSIVVKLEEGYIDVVPVDTLHGWAGNLGKLARHSDNGTQILSRYYYWMGRIANRTGARSLGYLNKARELCDSVRFPYDAMRIGILLTLRNDTLSAAGRYARLKHYERFIDLDNDDFMKASLLLDLGHILYDVGEEERALQNYREADAIYQRLGMTTYHLKTSLNIANMLNMQGRTDEARELSLRLLESPVARHDTTFYNNLRLVAYHITHDTAYLEAGYGEEILRGHGNNLCLKYEILLGRSALEAGNLPGCANYIGKIFTGSFSEIPAGFRLPVYELVYDFYSAVENPDSAFRYCRLLSGAQNDELKESTPLKVAAIENHTRIKELEQRAQEKRRDDYLRLVIIISTLIITAMICAFVLFRRAQRSKIALMQSRLEFERSQRSETATRLAMIETNRLLESLMSKISDLKSEGKLDEGVYNELSQNIKVHGNSRQEWMDFKHVFETIHPSFASRLKEHYPLLSEGDLKMATYIKIGLSTKVISRMLSIQPDSVKKNRQRLRRRMGLESDSSLEETLRAF